MSDNNTYEQPSPAELVTRYLIEEANVVSFVADERDWPAFVDHLPEKPNQAVSVRNTSGILEGRNQQTGETFEKPGVQVRVRANDPAAAYHKIKELMTNIDAVRRATLTMEDGDYILIAVNRTSSPLSIGPDAQNRWGYTINALVTYTGAE